MLLKGLLYSSGPLCCTIPWFEGHWDFAKRLHDKPADIERKVVRSSSTAATMSSSSDPVIA